MSAVVAVLRMVGMFLPFLARLIPTRFKPAGPIEPLRKEPWAGK